MEFYNMKEVRRANKEAGRHWFSPASLQFFSSGVGDELYGGRYFITSEQFLSDSSGLRHAPGRSVPDGERLFTVRKVTPKAHIDTVGESQAYKSKLGAQLAIEAILEAETVVANWLGGAI